MLCRYYIRDLHHAEDVLMDGFFKEKIENNLNFNDLIYGVSGYVSLPRVLTLYAKADLSPLFKNQSYLQNNISLGIRLDID